MVTPNTDKTGGRKRAMQEMILGLSVFPSMVLLREESRGQGQERVTQNFQRNPVGAVRTSKREVTLQVAKNQSKSQHLSAGQSWVWGSLEWGPFLGIFLGFCPDPNFLRSERQ